MIIWAGFDQSFNFTNTGGRYNPGMNSWIATSINGAPSGRESHVAVWTGSEMIVWGGYAGFPDSFNTGGRYCAGTPSPTPTPTPTPAPVRVSVIAAPTQINEGQSATYTVSASATVTQSITVNYSMSGTATLNTDYTLSGTAGQVTILTGQSSAAVRLKAKTDGITEGTETAIMTLQPGSGYRLGNPKQATVSILDSP